MLKRAILADGINVLQRNDTVAAHLGSLSARWVPGTRGKQFKMDRTRRNSRLAAFSLAHPGRNSLGSFRKIFYLVHSLWYILSGPFYLVHSLWFMRAEILSSVYRHKIQVLDIRKVAAGLHTRTPLWLLKSKLLATVTQWISAHLIHIWYGQSVLFWTCYGIALITVSVLIVWTEYGLKLDSNRFYLKILIYIWGKIFLGVYYSEACLVLLFSDWDGWSFLLPHPFSLFCLIIPAAMAPRLRGISRRGSSSGVHGGVGGRGEPIPRCISPLASVSPDSPSSDHSSPSLHSSFHFARFKFKSKLHKPSISALITVIFSKEEDSSSSEEQSQDKSPSPSSNDS